MKAQSRRNAIMEVLQKEEQPISASTLAKRYNVSRQIIVGDVALLRAGGGGYFRYAKGIPAGPGQRRNSAADCLYSQWRADGKRTIYLCG